LALVLVMDEANIGIEYLSAGANRHTAVADWSENGVVAFGADSNIALWQPVVSRIHELHSILTEHNDRIQR
jgi:elongator complex protein 2